MQQLNQGEMMGSLIDHCAELEMEMESFDREKGKAMLFESEDLFEKKIAGAVESHSANEFAVFAPEDRIREKLGHLTQNTTKHFVSGGVWALHDLVKYCLQEMKQPAAMVGYSWSLTTPAAEKLLHYRRTGQLSEMSFIFDCGMSQWSRGALGLLKEHSHKVVTTMIHAKGFIIWNSEWQIAVISSANFSNNPRIEAGTLSTDPEVFQFHKRWINRTLEEGNPFEAPPTTENGIPVPPVEDTGKVVYIIRGLPGCGKSTLARSLADVVCEQDEFFMNGNHYQFAPDAMPLAIAHCKNKFKEAIDDGVQRIAVANVFGKESELDYYKHLATRNGYRVFVLLNQNTNNTQNVHGLKTEQIEKMKKHFEVTL